MIFRVNGHTLSCQETECFFLNKLKNKNLIWGPDDIQKTLVRMAHEIIESHPSPTNLLLAGIKTRGVLLSDRLSSLIKHFKNVQIPCISLDIKFYRDDIKTPDIQPHSIKNQTEKVANKNIILVDDVLYTGRSVRAALNALTDLGRPELVSLAVLIDRGHRELPITPNYVGKNIPTHRNQKIHVFLKEIDNIEGVYLSTKNENA